ncbi:MAG: DNA double-strand break repair nuclease NurA [Chloroherpetonaceae bacterium]|nr:DNA double-strand break repair nuclease NurA [Chloroherpetonaceae bacterium]MDW8437388.1 DNA double-strand break repair nuclease NurA [Chloroherpetonaceae bacterium]
MLQLQAIYPTLERFAEKVAAEHKRLGELKPLLERLFRDDSLFVKQWRDFPETLQSTIAPRLVESPSKRVPCPKRPDVFTICSADGSQIYPDRLLNFCLLNFSQICFHIGASEKPAMNAYAKLYDAETFFKNYFKGAPPKDIEDKGSETSLMRIANDQVNALRQTKELSALLHVAKNHRVEARPILAIADGTLICWTLKNAEALRKEFIEKLAEFRQANIPVLAYKSLPETESVAKAVECLAADDLQRAGIRPETLSDAEIFRAYLRKGERSAIFQSRSDIVEKHYSNPDKVYFFYLHAGNEIARVEFPAWCYEKGHVDLMHSVVMDDLEKGKGYPMTLMEAHELAAVKKDDEKRFFELLEKQCLKRGVRISDSAKVASKRAAII